jgi:hypothetical protein
LQPEVRAKWVAVVAETANAMDGVFVDRGDLPGSPGGPSGKVAPDKLAAWGQGHAMLVHELRHAIPDKILLLNDHTLSLTGNQSFPRGFDHEYEAFKGSMTQIQQL